MRDNLLESPRGCDPGAHVIGFLRKAAIAALLMAAAGNVWALGLGQIQVKSKRNQPLLAEIPVISTTPGELAALQARMASPETFRRIGLPQPSGVAAELQFSLGSDARGRPVIRVTSIQPVDQGVLNFLIEVDWGTGKLVREYSALVDVPNTASALPQANVQMATVAPSNLVQRPDVPAAPPATPAPAQPEPAPQPAPVASALPAPTPANAEAAEGQANAVDVAPPVEAPPPPAPVPAVPVEAAPAPAMAASADAGQYGPVKRGDTLSSIAGGLGLRASYSLDQTMLALLHANPAAFIGENINRLRRGSVLRIPDGGEVGQIDAGQATEVVRQQMQAWRQDQRPVLQPETSAAADTANAGTVRSDASAARPTSAASKPAARPATNANRAPAATASVQPAAAARHSEARLEIVPPTGDRRATGAQTGTGNGGGGSMLQQQLRQRDEEISAKSAEIGELKERVAELERIRDEQHQLLSMKDSELAAAQHRLAEANRTVAQPAPAAASATAATPPATAMHTGKSMYYLGGGVGVLLVGLLVWLVARKRKPEPTPAPKSAFVPSSLAASMQELDRKRANATAKASAPSAAAASDKPEDDKSSASAAPATIPGRRGGTPAWHSGWVVKDPAAGAEATGSAEASTPAAEAPKAAPAPAPADEPVATHDGPPAQASADQRFKLVDAFLDMGDRTSAQQLLAELLNDEDDAVSEKAGKMLARIMG